MRYGDVTITWRNLDRRLQRGKQAAEARAALFTRAPEDEEAARADGCIWCGHPPERHQWDYAPVDGNTRHMRLNMMECFDCAAELSTHQAICYLRPQANGRRPAGRGGAGQTHETPAPPSATRESGNNGKSAPPPPPPPAAQQQPANQPPTPTEPEPPQPAPPPASTAPGEAAGKATAQQLALWPAS